MSKIDPKGWRIYVTCVEDGPANTPCVGIGIDRPAGRRGIYATINPDVARMIAAELVKAADVQNKKRQELSDRKN